MKKRVTGLLLFSIVFLVNLSLSDDYTFAQEHKNFLWKVQSKNNTVYLLGSIHFMKKDIYPLNKKIEDAFDKSDILSVEANISDIGQIDIQKLMDTAFYRNNDSLENHITKETYELIKKEFEGFGMPQWIINKQKPWILALTLTSLELIKSGFDPKYGIDAYFLSKASGKKKIKELESIDYQINLLSGFSDSEQEAFLLSTLKDLGSPEKKVETLIKAWIAGDTKSMESQITKSITEDRRLAAVYEKILYERNNNIVSKIEDYLKTEETHFVIVGAGHLVGNRGIIEILSQKGYPVEQM